MKKVVSSLFACTLAIMMSFSSVFAANYDTSKIDNAYNNVVNYYKDNKTLNDESSPDNFMHQIIAVESLGLEAEEGFNIPKLNELKTKNYNEVDNSYLSKAVITLILLGIDPKNVNGQNLIDILESRVNDDGSILNSAGNNYDIWYLFALESISSEKVEVVANYIANDNNNDGGFWNTDYYDSTKKVSSLDITGWGIEALTIAKNLVKDENIKINIDNSINKAKQYLLNNENEQAVFGIENSYEYEGKTYTYTSANANTQACVLEGLLTYNKEAVLNGTYDKGENNPIDYLLSWQLDSYSFGVDWDNNDPKNAIHNDWATFDAARCLGTYKNGSFVYKAQKAYQAFTIKAEENKPVEQLPSQTEVQNQPSTTNTETKSVKTGDNTEDMLFMSVAIISGGLYLVLRKEYERIH